MELGPRYRSQISLYPEAGAGTDTDIPHGETLARPRLADHRYRYDAAEFGFAAVAGSRCERPAGPNPYQLLLAVTKSRTECPGRIERCGAAGVAVLDRDQRQDRGGLSVHPDEGQGREPYLLHDLLPGCKIMGAGAWPRSGSVLQPFAPAHQAEIPLRCGMRGARYLQNAGAQEPGGNAGVSGDHRCAYSGAIPPVRYLHGASGTRTPAARAGFRRFVAGRRVFGKALFDVGGKDKTARPLTGFLSVPKAGKRRIGFDLKRRTPWIIALLTSLLMATQAGADDTGPAARAHSIENVRSEMRDCKTEVKAAGKAWLIGAFEKTGHPGTAVKPWLAKQKKNPGFMAELKAVKAAAASRCGEHNRALRREAQRMVLATLDEEWRARQKFYEGKGLKLREDEEGRPVLYGEGYSGEENLFAIYSRDPKTGETVVDYTPLKALNIRLKAFSDKMDAGMWDMMEKGDVKGLETLLREAEEEYKSGTGD